MDMLGKATSKPLRDIVRQYKHQLPILHPFEATLADLTVRAREKTGERTLQVSRRRRRPGPSLPALCLLNSYAACVLRHAVPSLPPRARQNEDISAA